MDIDELALQLANKALSKGFDAEAYLVKYVAEKKLNVDLVEGTEIDDNIQRLLNFFVQYYERKTNENFLVLTQVLQQIVTELYMCCEGDEQKQYITKCIKNLNNII